MKTIIPVEPIGLPKGYPAKLTYPEIAERFQQLLGPFKDPSVPLQLRVTDEKELAGGVIRQRVEYHVDHDEIVPALHLFRKDIPGNAPGVLSIHGHGGGKDTCYYIFPVGKEYQSHPDCNDPFQYSYRAALEGFRVLAPDALCFGERQIRWGLATEFMDEINTHEEFCSRGKSLAWKSVWDNSRAVEALESLGASRVGAIGWSGGSTQAYILAAANVKVRAAACFLSFATLRHQFYQYRLGHCFYHYIPNMVNAGIDWDQVVSLIPPRKIFLGWCALDEGSPEVMYRAFVDAIEKRCGAEGLKKSVFVHEEAKTDHTITSGMLTAAMEFLKGYVK
ncbi:MAG: hypothetical protein WC081_01340 [Candidatus Ratteibacteria bacterium]|jgi:dienelactone hydrolase